MKKNKILARRREVTTMVRKKEYIYPHITVDRYYKQKPVTYSLYWGNEFLCSFFNDDALRIASKILQAQKGKPKK